MPSDSALPRAEGRSTEPGEKLAFLGKILMVEQISCNSSEPGCEKQRRT